ncbi:MAG: phage late control D family protein [Treponema sp.]|nr:phage late control D family protein [Treponema sp.]
MRRIRVSDRLDGIGRCVIEFGHPAVALLEKGAIVPESAVDVHLGYKDDCGKVFGGEVTGLEYGYSEHGGECLRVTVSGRLHRLRNAMRSVSYERKTAGGFVTEMLDRYGLKADVEDFGPEREVSVHHLESDWDFLIEHAKRYGRSVYEQDGTVYVRNEITVSQDDIVLEFGKSMISFRVRESLDEQISKCTYTGWNMLKAEGVTGSAEVGEVPVKAGGGTSWSDEARILPGMWESVIDSQGVTDAEDARNRALGELQNASMEWQRAEVRCEGDHRIQPGMRVTLKYVGERFSGEYVAERVEHEFGIDGFITEVHLRRNMLPGEPNRPSAIDEERERQHNAGGAAKESGQDDAEEQEEEKNPTITNPQWNNADGEPITKALVGDEVTLCADVTDIPDGTGAKIKIVEKDADGQDDDVATLTAKVSGGRIECAWKVVYTEDDDDADSEQEKAEKGYTLPEYAFTMECGGVTSEESGQLDVMGWIKTQYVDKNGNPLPNKEYVIYLLDGTCISGTTDDGGYVKEYDLKHGKYYIVFKE